MSKIRIAIDAGDFAPGSKINSGIKRLIKEFIDEIRNYPEYIIHYYYFSDKFPGESMQGNIHYVRMPSALYATLHLPLGSLIRRDDVFLAFSGYIPSLLCFLPIKNIAFIHDFGFFKYPDAYNNPEKLKYMTETTIQKADKIVVFSDYVNKELIARYPSVKSNVTTIHAGIDHIQYSSISNKEYFLYVGVVKPVKDVQRLIDCFAKYTEQTRSKNKLIIVGSKEKEYFAQIIQSDSYAKVKDAVQWIEGITDDELKNYYANAKAIINLSKEEGFGYPVLEGLVAGKKVIVSSIDIYKEYQIHFPHLIMTQNDEEVIKELNTEYKSHSAVIPNEFTWKTFTQKLLDVIKSV
jgi:glycosyltransferase involved in cell wall biosynthesis